MRNGLLAALACTVAAVSLAAPGHAAAKVCNLIVDKPDDDRYNVQAHDLTGGDIATGRSKLVAVIRVRSLADDPKATVYGATYRFNFSIGTARYMFELRRALGSEDNARMFQNNVEAAKPQVQIDTQRHQIVFTAARATFAGLRKSGARITELNLDSGTGTVAVINTDNGIPAKAGTAYVDKTPSCVAAG